MAVCVTEALLVLVHRPAFAAVVRGAALELQYLQPARYGLGNLLAQLLGARVRIEQAVAQEGKQVLELAWRKLEVGKRGDAGFQTVEDRLDRALADRQSASTPAAPAS